MSAEAEWWRSFYSGKYVDFHKDAIYTKDTSGEVDWFLELLQPRTKGHILDIGCGEGRHSLELASRGYVVTGVDFSEVLLDIAKEKAKDRGLNTRFELCDMRDLPWKETFDAAISVWGSFGVFEDNGNADLVKAVFGALKPGGRFLIENHSLETLLTHFWTTTWQSVGDHLIRLEARHFDHVNSRLESEWTFLDPAVGQIERQTMTMRIYSYRELCALLENSGFCDPQGYDTSSRKPFSLDAHRLTLVARKLL